MDYERNESKAEPVFGRSAKVEFLTDGSWRYEVCRDARLPSLSVSMWPDVRVVIELPDTADIEVVRGDALPQLDALYVLVQPEVVSRDWRKGWVPVGRLDEVYLREQNSLELARLDGDPVLFAYSDHLEFEQTGSFPMYIRVSRT